MVGPAAPNPRRFCPVCDVSCASCVNPINLCSACAPGYYQLNTATTPDFCGLTCPSGKWANGAVPWCEPCNTPCATCALGPGNGFCLTCVATPVVNPWRGIQTGTNYCANCGTAAPQVRWTSDYT
jgi:hypothetical protein